MTTKRRISKFFNLTAGSGFSVKLWGDVRLKSALSTPD